MVVSAPKAKEVVPMCDLVSACDNARTINQAHNAQLSS